jgi:hypothetical protein
MSENQLNLMVHDLGSEILNVVVYCMQNLINEDHI